MVYVAGHGAADHQQYFLLNEKDIDEIFCPIEQKNRLLLKRCGQRCKMFAIYDCCREDVIQAKEKMV